MRKLVNVGSINAIKDFVNTAVEVPYDVRVYSGPYVVDGKSVMGLFSLDLSSPVYVEVLGPDESHNEKELEKFNKFN